MQRRQFEQGNVSTGPQHMQDIISQIAMTPSSDERMAWNKQFSTVKQASPNRNSGLSRSSSAYARSNPCMPCSLNHSIPHYGLISEHLAYVLGKAGILSIATDVMFSRNARAHVSPYCRSCPFRILACLFESGTKGA